MTFVECKEEKPLLEICKESGSKRVRQSSRYLRAIMWQAGDKFTAEIADGVGFYAGNFTQKHFNLVECAVKKDYQRQGMGGKIVARMKSKCLEKGVNKIRLRTSFYETAVDFWQKQGAKIIGCKGDDFVMEIDL